jgi:hypothetical protein
MPRGSLLLPAALEADDDTYTNDMHRALLGVLAALDARIKALETRGCACSCHAEPDAGTHHEYRHRAATARRAL